jgi:hypothetical protein
VEASSLRPGTATGTHLLTDYDGAMSDAPKTPAGAQQIQIDLDEVTAQGMYCNLVLINHTDAEFILDFAFLQPSTPQARVRARILSSPRHTKRLLRALETNLQRYEERFGKIDELPMPDHLVS